MKKNNLLLHVLILASSYAIGQSAITLTFTGEINGGHQSIDSIFLQNLSRGGDTTLYGSDTVMVLEHGIGVHDFNPEIEDRMILYPNPVTDQAVISLQIAREAPVVMKLFDLSGREQSVFSRFLSAGFHTFTLIPGKGGVFLLVVETSDKRMVKHLINTGTGEGSGRFEYNGHRPVLKERRLSNGSFPWVPGDQLKLTGFAGAGMDSLEDNPFQSTLYTFHFPAPIPPPVANFSVSDTLAVVNDAVYFADLSSGVPTFWKWYFGDADSSILQNPGHIYTTSGSYSITLMVSNAGGSDTLTKYHLITVDSAVHPGNPCPGVPTVTDINGNVYRTVQIGSQCWMGENLKVNNYKNGNPIPLLSNAITWTTSNSGGRCWYNNDSATYACVYGGLYNWYAVSDTNGLCPMGWHVPTDPEWTILTDFYGGLSVAGGPLKDVGTTHWNSPNAGATNAGGFTALPGGSRTNGTGNFGNEGSIGHWWTSSPNTIAGAWYRKLFHYIGSASRGNIHERNGFSVRCIKD